MRLSHKASPWVFLPIIDRAIAQAAGDFGLALLGVRTLAALGLRSPALERLDSIDGARARSEAVGALRNAVRALPSEVIPLSRRLKMAERNVAALWDRGIDLREAFDRWSDGESEWEHLRAIGGNVIRRPAGAPNSADWLWVGDLHDAMDRFVSDSLSDVAPSDYPRVAIEGVDPPWLLLAYLERTAGGPFGYEPEITALQSDIAEFFEGLSLADLRGCIGSSRVRFFIGPDASERSIDEARGRFGDRLSGIGVTSGTTRSRLSPGVAESIRIIDDAQRGEADRLCELAHSPYKDRDAAWWSARYAQAMAEGSDRPLRVLIPSCRYTTWVRHAASSLRDALQRRGCLVELLIEPDTHTYLHECAFHRAVVEHEPDLVVLINFTRAGCGRAIPANVPYVCWIQDSLPQLFNLSTGASQGEMDFVVGNVYDALLTRFGFRADRALRLPVAADAAVFKPTLFSIGASPRFDTEIAYVSHHSETPGSMLERLIREDGVGRNEGMLRAIAGRIHALLKDTRRSAFRQPLRRAVEAAVAVQFPESGNGEIAARTFQQFAIPLAERVIRHEMIGWASDIATARGWRLTIYGNGWETHPHFGDHARGAMDHGAALRDCYERSAVQLHASVCNPAHQRVQECALSGGFPLSRITRDSLQVEYEIMRLGAMGRIEPAACDDKESLVGFRIADDPELMAIAAQLQRLGMSMEPGPDDSLLWIEREDWDRRGAATAIPMIDTRTRWLFGDYSRCAFTDETGLERLVERAIESPSWRRGVIDGIAGRVRERLTIDAVAPRILGFVHEGLRRCAPGAGR